MIGNPRRVAAGGIVAGRLGSVLLAATAVAWAHFTWIAPAVSPLVAGQTTRVQIGSGHHFPKSETALSLAGVEVYAIAPSGKKTVLQSEVAGTSLAADYKVEEAGMHRFVLLQDRGVLSWTTNGVRPGGKAEHPGAIRSARVFRSAVSYGLTPGSHLAKAKPLGIAFEMTAEVSGGEVILTVLKDSKPCAGAEIRLATGDHGDKALGRTAADGRLVHALGSGAKGAMLFAVEQYIEPAPASANYDRAEFAASVQLQL
jgi:uncharacterized GH25 family protein